jgi:tetraacyldisaccharide 4'-kinase
MASWLYRVWYGKRSFAWLCLWPFSLIYRFIIFLKKSAYRLRLCKIIHIKPKVIVVGNITVGGAGKTPMVMALAKWCAQHNLKVGVITKGYGGAAAKTPQLVTTESLPKDVGDEACMLAHNLKCPIIACHNRVEALKTIDQDFDLDVVISDDGLSNLALGRDLSIVMEHAKYGLGNGSLLPAGPLREPQIKYSYKRWLVKSHTIAADSEIQETDELTVWRYPAELINLTTNQSQPLSFLKDKIVHAVAGIAHPKSFFDLLEKLGVKIIKHSFQDHYAFQQSDLNFPDEYPIIMTEKDAIKCKGFKREDIFFVKLSSIMSMTVQQSLNKILQ